MSEENVEIARRFFGFWPDRDFSAIEEFMDPDGVIDMSRNIFNPGIYRGIDGFRDWVAVVDETWDDFRADPEEFIEVGDALVTAVRVSGIGRSSGVQTEMLIFGIWRFDQGKVARFTGGYRDRADALEAAGLSE
jgi:ketosteroid isomerase-like protein